VYDTVARYVLVREFLLRLLFLNGLSKKL